jgi:DUF1365 family protein
MKHGFHHNVVLWLVDLDDVPQLPWYLRPLASFSSRDHLGPPTGDDPAGIRRSLERFLHGRGVHLDGRVLMLANARTLGHVFDPITVYWCLRPDDTLRCIVAEVHNTYGERHAYVLEPDESGEASVDKEFYVSPFNDVSGRYTLRFTLTKDQVQVQVTLTRGGEVVFDAGFDGVPEQATSQTLLRTALLRPASSQKVSLLIRLHGIYPWLRRLPVAPRPVHTPQEGLT